MTEAAIAIQESNRAAAEMWGSGGKHYNEVSFAICDALAHAAGRLCPRPGEAVLDVATGTGWSARNAALFGAKVSAVDISPTLIDAARTLSRAVDPPIDFKVGEAENLPFPDRRFDKVISTFGVMFAADHEAAARELARVTRPGGRLSLANWVPDGAVAEFFGVLAEFTDAPPPSPSPLDWGRPDYLESLLGKDFELTFERGINHAYHDSEDAIWQWYLRGFGPLKAVHDRLDAQGRKALKEAVDAYHRHYRVDAGLCVKREYLITVGKRR
ncbi:methyltransferase domain-containing protein [Stappia sp. GBMRC 2046]|uniref:Methyltransferase domain-containing protein n=1 Tax=Stappia sediminis TaxID=2692190 RepID=A0A7X3LRU0_9HYPH|nr:class I SAM-dependent methyltransferase [Stappia sediminis]MXN63911.1 methyltransferase domain-containing protein [Stappia sediminis]